MHMGGCDQMERSYFGKVSALFHSHTVGWELAGGIGAGWYVGLELAGGIGAGF